MLFEIEQLKVNYGKATALDGISLDINEGEIVSIVGANGAGKTTLFDLISGFLEPDTGEVLLAGNLILGLRPDQICKLGLVRTFQIVKPFAGLTVFKNIMVVNFKYIIERL